MDDEISEIADPAFVDAQEAADYEEQGFEFDGEGWYVQAMVKVKTDERDGFDVGSEVPKYFGPFDTERDAKAAIPEIAPGVFVGLE